MPINEFDLLLTYKCNLECDHCFVYSSPNAEGVREIFPEILAPDQMYGIMPNQE